MAGICPGCVIGPACGSFVGAWLVSRGYSFGYYLETPKRLGTKILSFALVSNYTVLTTLFIKSVLHVSFCGPQFTFKRAAVILLAATAVGVLYTLPINYLLNRFVDPRPLPIQSKACSHKSPEGGTAASTESKSEAFSETGAEASSLSCTTSSTKDSKPCCCSNKTG